MKSPEPEEAAEKGEKPAKEEHPPGYRKPRRNPERKAQRAAARAKAAEGGQDVKEEPDAPDTKKEEPLKNPLACPGCGQEEHNPGAKFCFRCGGPYVQFYSFKLIPQGSQKLR